MFEVLRDDKTGIHFANRLTPGNQFNMFYYMYFYNGAGIGAGVGGDGQVTHVVQHLHLGADWIRRRRGSTLGGCHRNVHGIAADRVTACGAGRDVSIGIHRGSDP